MVEGKTRKDRVDWTTDEIEKLASLVAKMRIKDPISPGQLLIQKAMQQLPEHRRRTVGSVKQVPKLAKEIIRHMQSLGDLAEKGSLPPPPPPEPPPAPPPPPTADEIIAKLPTEKLLTMLFGRLMGVVHGIQDRQGSLEEQLKRLSVYHPVSLNGNGETQSPLIAPMKPRIAVVGLLGNQQQEVAKVFSSKAELRFLNKDQSKPSFPQCDYIVLVTKFISHYWDNAAFSALHKDRVFRHRGGLSELINLLHTLC